ncbi:hypothetical protein MVES1_002083 [Malassezia vespertilionis]|uniref:BOD1/SHG1 domain-containing protein n=1 Tax=Malassezia vespertilionis TaxID=2020962 RepID=A0A2N1JBW6_9BASI|nr:uncharacterized protein MVES1_002083 [Malassezia vespertilionis]PKI84038.1 hypothetical protein MVES_001969 [Malassezia vespertilionis]WFD06729.1 hypothetical protein MVES1_002083 [Malassezia vespertilionis]
MPDSPALSDPGTCTVQLTSDALIDEFKRQGHFDQARKQLFQNFQQSAHHAAFLEQSEACMMQYVDKEADRLVYRDARLRHGELMRALEQLPLFTELVESLSKQTHDMGTDVPKEAMLGAQGQIAQQMRSQLAQMIFAQSSGNEQVPSNDLT